MFYWWWGFLFFSFLLSLVFVISVESVTTARTIVSKFKWESVRFVVGDMVGKSYNKWIFFLKNGEKKNPGKYEICRGFFLVYSICISYYKLFVVVTSLALFFVRIEIPLFALILTSLFEIMKALLSLFIYLFFFEKNKFCNFYYFK